MSLPPAGYRHPEWRGRTASESYPRPSEYRHTRRGPRGSSWFRLECRDSLTITARDSLYPPVKGCLFLIIQTTILPPYWRSAPLETIFSVLLLTISIRV